MGELRQIISDQLSTARFAAQSLLELISPPRCMRCLIEGTWWCSACAQRPLLFYQSCLICGEEKPTGVTCSECSRQTDIHGIISAGPYFALFLRRGIHWLKFKGVKELSLPLASLLVRQLPKIAPHEKLRQEAVLIPMPLNKRRLLERGFNQSEEIAKSLNALTGIPILHGLSRPRATFIQTQLPHELRSKNVANAFAAKESVPAHIRFIILIDDVATTGSTLSAAASVIPVSDNQEIWAATIARG